MGLEAYVNCNCWKEGKAKPPPVPIKWVHGLVVADIARTNRFVWTDEDEAVSEWQKTACEHPNMEYVSEWIANWFVYRNFKNALSKTGWIYFPTLFSVLPNTNDGSVQSPDAAICLGELKIFSRIADLNVVYLINSETGEEIHSYLDGFIGWFTIDTTNNWRYAIDSKGLFVFDIVSGKEVFRSRRFEQHIVENNGVTRAEYVDIESGTRFTSASTIKASSDWQELGFARLLRTETRHERVDYYTYILNPLLKVFQAAVDTGNPVYWS